MNKNYLLGIIFLILFVYSCHKDNNITVTNLSPPAHGYSSEQLRNYFSLMCTITRSTKGFFPTQAARAYGYVGLSAYESVVHGIPGALSLYGQINGLARLPTPDSKLEYNWAISSNAAIAEMIRKMFDVNLSAINLRAIDSVETVNLATLSRGVNQDIINRSVSYGRAVTSSIYQSSTSDGGHQAYINPFHLPYTLPACDYCWVPTNPAVTNPVSPEWGGNRPFIVANIAASPPNAPPTFSTDTGSSFYSGAKTVYDQVNNNTADEVEIVKFWADDPINTCTPAGHTFNILIQLLKENNATLEKASVAFAKLSIAENDVFISCWKGKFQYNLLRPVSYIKKYIDPNFKTVIGTPPFPSYTSGHSYEIGAAAIIFSDMFTDGSGNYDLTDYSQLQYGFQARHYSNFNDMAMECAKSRFYGGIHYNCDNTEGLRLGRLIADNVNKMIVWPTGIK
jgi:hypothetical protein